MYFVEVAPNYDFKILNIRILTDGTNWVCLINNTRQNVRNRNSMNFSIGNYVICIQVGSYRSKQCEYRTNYLVGAKGWSVVIL